MGSQAPGRLQPRPLGRVEQRGAMRQSLVEGTLWASMVGASETFFIADAVRMGASATELGLVVGLPLAAGSLGSLAALRLLRRVRRRRPIVGAAAFLQVLNLMALAGWNLLDRLSPELLVLHVCFHHITSMASGSLWSSWFGDLVPARLRGRYFARRNALVQISTMLAVVAAGATLQLVQPTAGAELATGHGFALLYGAAALSRALSATLLLRTAEPPFTGLSTGKQTLRFLRTERGSRASRVLLLGGLFQLATYFASPYFTPYMLRELRFSWLQLTAATVSMMLVKSLMLRQWGRLVDRHGPRPVFALSAVLGGLVPVPWLAAGGLPMVLVAESFSGFAWAGYELSYFATLLETSYRRTRPIVFAAQNLFNGAGQLLGSLIGAAILTYAAGSFVAVFAASAVARLLLAAIIPRALPDPIPELAVGRRTLMLRVVGFRPHGGLVHRLIETPPPVRKDVSRVTSD
jgi:MFS family permease